MSQLFCCCNFARYNDEYTPLTTGAPTGEEWYHRDMTDDEAERAMRSSGKPQEGLYLVYDKPEFIGVPCCRRYPEYVLLVNVSDEQFELHAQVSDHPTP